MSYNESYEKHMDIFVNNFFVNGARNYIRKTTEDAPWLSMGIMENTNPEMFYSCRLFRGMNIFGGSSCSLGHGLIPEENVLYHHQMVFLAPMKYVLKVWISLKHLCVQLQ